MLSEMPQAASVIVGRFCVYVCLSASMFVSVCLSVRPGGDPVQQTRR